MNIVFSKNAWEDYVSWQKENKNVLRRINELIKDINRLIKRSSVASKGLKVVQDNSSIDVTSLISTPTQ